MAKVRAVVELEHDGEFNTQQLTNWLNNKLAGKMEVTKTVEGYVDGFIDQLKEGERDEQPDDIESPKRIKVTFTGEGGYGEQEAKSAKQYLEVGKEYEICAMEVDRYRTDYQLVGVARTFNSALFSPGSEDVRKAWPVEITRTGSYRLGAGCEDPKEAATGSWPKEVQAEVKIRPDYRNDTEHGQYQFIVGISHFGAPECVHLTFDEIARRLRIQHGPGTLEDDGTWLTFTLFEGASRD